MSTTSSPPVVSTPNRRNTNPPSYSDVEKEKTHKVNKFYALVSNADNSKEILTAFIAKVSKKGSKGRKEKEPVGSPTFVLAFLRSWEINIYVRFLTVSV